MKNILVGILLSLACSGCRSTTVHSGVETAILPKDQCWFATGLHGVQYYNYSPWTPSNCDIAQAFPKIEEFFNQLSIDRSLNKYRCQAIGIVFDEKKHIYFNFFIPYKGRFTYWKQTPVGVDDGGDNFFQILFNVETQKCIRYWINGDG